MKRILTLFLIFTLVLCSSFAAGQLYTMAFDSGWNNAIDGPYMGFHMLYHYGASVSENTTVGCGSLIDVDFGLKRFSKGDYIADIAMGFGPSFATDVNVNLTINGMIARVHRMSVVVYAIHPKFADKVQVSVLLALQEEKTPVLNAVLQIRYAHLNA